MSSLKVSGKTLLESVLGMGGGYVLDFSTASFANFFRDLNIDIYDADRYPGFGDSKANRMRAFWKSGTDSEVGESLVALAEYIEARKLANPATIDTSNTQVARLREIGAELLGEASSASAAASFTTEATVSANKIQIEIHEELYKHIDRYLSTEDYFHAVEESYKVVREALRDKTGSERASDAFKPENQPKIFGHLPVDQVESDFFDGVKHLNMAIQFLRNEKSHSLAAPIERNLALHYISLASLAYDLVTRYVSEELVQSVEVLVAQKRRQMSASAFYRVFENGKWLQGLELPEELESSSVRKVLRDKWLEEIDLTRSWDHSNVMFMRLELVADVLTTNDIDRLLGLPMVDANGFYQEAGMLSFLEYMQSTNPGTISAKASDWMKIKQSEYEDQ